MARHNLTRPRTLGIGLAVVSLAFVACSRSTTSPLPTPTSVATAAPTAPGSPSPLSSPCAISLGIAYEPDAGNGGAFKGVQVTHFEDANQNLCAATAAPNATPPAVAFAASVGPLAFAIDRSDAIAVLQSASGGFTLAQDIFGAAAGAIVPVGTPYDLRANPPAPANSASPSPGATPSNAPLLADAQSIAILGSGSTAVALTTGLAAAGSPAAVIALTSLTNAPPQYGGAVPFTGSNYALKNIPQTPRSIVRVGTDANQIVALVRGPQDLLSFGVTFVGSGYQFDAKAVDTTLGTNTTLRGSGAIAFDPQDAGRALVGGTTNAGGGSTLTLVTGLPNAIVKASTLAVPGNIRSIAATNNGSFAIVGTDAGIVVVKGIDTGTLAIVPPFAPAGGSNASVPTYRTCTGAPAPLSSIYSVAVSGDQRFLVALGTTPGLTCASGYNASIVALPFSTATGTTPTPAPSAPASGSPATPAPASFVQNNIIAPPPGADYFVAF
ncbi:MAG: hypothetical protein NVS3B16_20340 [Vulcanimicrobiaceae bacterium]